MIIIRIWIFPPPDFITPIITSENYVKITILIDIKDRIAGFDPAKRAVDYIFVPNSPAIYLYDTTDGLTLRSVRIKSLIPSLSRSATRHEVCSLPPFGAGKSPVTDEDESI